MRFSEDRRGQSIQVGAVLLFGIIIILLSLWQAFAVPNQNADVEFDHYQQTERDMLELRSEILRAKTTGDDAFATLQLGTSFPNRIVARNPPDPSGTVRTTENRTLTLENGAGTELDLLESDENRFIEYRPNYAEYREAGTIRYENTVVYNEFETGNLFLSNQRLLRGETLTLVPLHREFQASGKQTVSIEPIPGVLEVEEDVQDPTLRVGTNLTEAGWLELFDEQIEQGNLQPEDVSVSDGILTLDLTGSYDVEYAPVGLDRTPRGGERGSGQLEINPAAPGDIQLVGAQWNNNDDSVDLTFSNSAEESNSFSSGRVPFFEGANPNVTAVSVNGNDRTGAEDWPVPSELRNLDPNIELDAQSEATVTVDFTNVNLNQNQQWFIIEFRLKTGEIATYFVGGDFDL